MKDHLGSIHAVIDTAETVVSTQDFDMWGYELPGRTSEPVNAKYDFTGKERDTESGYDYFGARYYNSRIGKWGGIDELFEKHYDFTPYNYVLNNTLLLIDRDGRQGSRYYRDNKEGGGGGIGLIPQVPPPGGIVVIPRITLRSTSNTFNSGPVLRNQSSVPIQPTFNNVMRNPSILSGKNPQNIVNLMRSDIVHRFTPLGKGTLQNVPYPKGGFIIRELKYDGKKFVQTGNQIQFHPGGTTRHPNPYFKISSGKGGIQKFPASVSVQRQGMNIPILKAPEGP